MDLHVKRLRALLLLISLLLASYGYIMDVFYQPSAHLSYLFLCLVFSLGILLPITLFYVLYHPNVSVSLQQHPTQLNNHLPLRLQLLAEKMQQAKQTQSALHLILITSNQLSTQHLVELQQQLKSHRPFTDRLLLLSEHELALVFTQHANEPCPQCELLFDQVHDSLQQQLQQQELKLGMASMRQLDSPDILIKRAQAHQVSHLHQQKLNHFKQVQAKQVG